MGVWRPGSPGTFYSLSFTTHVVGVVNWGQTGDFPVLNEDDSILVRGDGIFLEQLKAELAERGLPIPRSTGIRHWHPDYDPEEERRRLEALLV